jgi:imidazolonepropionase
MARWDRLWHNINLATMTAATGVGEADAYGEIRNAALAVCDGRIAWLGEASQLTPEQRDCVTQTVDGKGAWMTPGLIDCHTHLVFGGQRAAEFELRQQGASYEAIARAGGGIVATVVATREASREQLVESALQRVERLLRGGVTTVEIKSGYGLETAAELKMLQAAARVNELAPISVETTFLGAHALPSEFAGASDAYIQVVCDDMLPRVAELGLVSAVDAFCETVGFSQQQTERVFARATELGLPVKLHADQLTDGGGAELAARFRALSADHLEYTSVSGVKAMAASGTVAVLLPGAFYFLRETRVPPVALLRQHQVPMAVATDFNPGSSPLGSLLLAMNMACTQFGLTPAEALAGATRCAAQALGLGHDRGQLAVGLRADLALWDIESPAELSYWIDGPACHGLVVAGEMVDIPVYTR